MAKTDPPRPSPRPMFPPELPNEPKTDPHLRAALDRHDNKLTVRSVLIAGGALVAGITTAIIFVDNRVAAQTDAGVRVLAAEQRAIDTRLTTTEKRLDRFDDKLDLLLDAARVPAWKRPPSDGGQ